MASKSKTAADKLSSSNLIIILVLITVLAVGVTAFAAKVLIADIIRDGKVYDAKRKAEANLKTDLDNAPGLIVSYQSLGPQLTTVLADALPTKADFPSLLVTFERMAGDAHILLTAVTPSALTTASASTDASGSQGGSKDNSGSDATPTPQKYDFNVTVSARYDTLQRFLGDIEKSARPMKVTSMRLSGGIGTPITGDIGLETYYQDEAKLPFSTRTIK